MLRDIYVVASSIRKSLISFITPSLSVMLPHVYSCVSTPASSLKTNCRTGGGSKKLRDAKKINKKTIF